MGVSALEYYRGFNDIGASFKGILKGVYKGSLMGFYIRGFNNFTYTILGGSEKKLKYNGPQSPDLTIKAPIVKPMLFWRVPYYNHLYYFRGSLSQRKKNQRRLGLRVRCYLGGARRPGGARPARGARLASQQSRGV